MKFFYESLLFLTTIRPFALTLAPYKKLTEILESSKYDKEVRPIPEFGNVTVVKVNMAIREILNIDDRKMELTSQMTLRQFWVDSRLEFDTDGKDNQFILVNDKSIDKLWSPDLFFSNEVQSYMHTTLKPNTYMRIYPNGNVMWSTRLTLTSSCLMDLHDFPFDNQQCTLKLSPYAYPKEDMTLEWQSEDPVVMLGNPLFSRFQLLNKSTSACEHETTIHGFSCIFVHLHFKRQFGYYLINIFAPCAMLVMLTWVSFWLGPSVGTRLTLTVTILLTLATQIQGFNQDGSKVSYTRAIDIWTGVSMGFATLAILESAYIAYLIQVHKEANTNAGNENNFTKWYLKMNNVNPMCPKAVKVDKISRIAFPLMYFMFITAYIVMHAILEKPIIPFNSVEDPL